MCRVDVRGLIRIRPLRWLAGGGVALVAAGVGVALAVQSGAAPACAAGTAAEARQGKATFYDLPGDGGGGNCSFVTAPVDRHYVALSPAEYADAAACGGHLDVTGPNGTVRVLVMDQCPECAPGHIDLSSEAFAEIADPVQGEVPVTYQSVVSPTLPDPLTFRMKDGTSQFWFAVLIGNHGNPLVSVQVKRSGQDWREAQRQDYNYWVIEDGLGSGPFTIQLTDVHGQQATVSGIELAPEQVQQTPVHMYAAGASPAAPPAAASPPAAVATPSPSPVPSLAATDRCDPAG